MKNPDRTVFVLYIPGRPVEDYPYGVELESGVRYLVVRTYLEYNAAIDLLIQTHVVRKVDDGKRAEEDDRPVELRPDGTIVEV